jgi:uncharacterized protein (TIGR02246 family)
MALTRVRFALPILIFVSFGWAATWAKPADSRDADSAAIKKLFADFNDAFNNHDAHAVAMLFADEDDFITVGGASFRGRTAIEQHLAPLFSGRAKTLHREAALRDIHFLSPDTALVTSDTVTSGMTTPDGGAVPAVKGQYDWVVLRQNGRWLIAVWHESNPTTPQGQPLSR